MHDMMCRRLYTYSNIVNHTASLNWMQLRTLCKAFRGNSKGVYILRDYQKANSKDELCALIDVITRWLSMYEMIKRSIKIRPDMEACLEKVGRAVREKFDALSEVDWAIVNMLEIGLRPIASLIKLVQVSHTVRSVYNIV